MLYLSIHVTSLETSSLTPPAKSDPLLICSNSNFQIAFLGCDGLYQSITCNYLRRDILKHWEISQIVLWGITKNWL